MTRPTVIWLHGLGDSGAGWSHLRQELRIDGVDFVFPDAPVAPVTCNGGMEMRSWMDLADIPVTLDTPGVRSGDAAGLDTSTEAVHKEIDKVVAKGTPASKILVGGFSQGGAMAVRSVYSYKEKLAGCVCFSGWAAQEDKLRAYLEEGKNKDTTAMVVHGTVDQVVLPACGMRVAEILEAAGTPVQAMTFQMAHSTHPQQMAQAARFVRACLGLASE